MGQDNNQGCAGGSCGQGCGRGKQFNKLQNNKSPGIKFYPHGSGKKAKLSPMPL